MQFSTRSDLLRDLNTLGLKDGDTVMVHSAMSALGHVLGGAESVIRALMDAVGESGTLVMPAFSSQLSDPADWVDPPVPSERLDDARAEIPLYDPAITPTRSMGAIPELFRRWPGVGRSPHPQVSVTAIGSRAEEILHPHDISAGVGVGSPFERLYRMDASLLLLGVGFNRASILHYAETRVPHGRVKPRRFPVDEGGARRWVEFTDAGDDLDTHFPPIGEAFIAAGKVRTGRVGAGSAHLMRMGPLVDFAERYLAGALEPDQGRRGSRQT